MEWLQVLARRQSWYVALLLSLVIAHSCAIAQTTSYAFSGTTGVYQSSLAVSVPVKMIANGVVATPEGLTLGIPGADFRIASIDTCGRGINFTIGQQCYVTVTFQPRYPGIRSGAVVLLDSDGSLLASTLLTGMATGSLSVLSPGEIDTVAGITDWLYQGDGGPASSATIFLPMGIVVDALGNLYLADSGNDRIRRVDFSTGLISTVAGNGTSGYSGDGGPAIAAMISNPQSLALDGAGIFIFLIATMM
jgi:hypothetical protein